MSAPPTRDEDRQRHVEVAAAWIYSGVWKIFSDWFRVPEQAPQLPATPGVEYRAFKPDLAFIRYLKLWFWIVSTITTLAALVLFIVLLIVKWWVALLLLPLLLLVGLGPDLLCYVAIHLRYDTTWYVMTDRSIRMRRGVWMIHETTITYENVQNVKVQQGPVQRLFGIASVIIETAGSGGEAGKKQMTVSNQGVIEGVTNAQEVRDLILTRLKRSRTTGLGDETGHQVPAWTPEHLAVLREIHSEISALHA